jgi:predicted nucleic acid-binding protein
MKVDQALHGLTRVAFDTSPIIYLVEAHPTYYSLVSNIFKRIASGEIERWTSVITLSEVLVRPILVGRNDLQKSYRDLLLGSSNFRTLPITATIAEAAARLRAVYGLRLPDAFQIAFALIPVVRQ